MNPKEVILGLILFAVFWAFHAGYAAPLGAHAWFVGSIIFIALLWAIGYSVMPKKPTDEVKRFWMLVSAFAIVVTFLVSYAGTVLGIVLPPGATAAALTPLVLSLWLIVLGSAMFVGGHTSKDNGQLWVGLLWLFSSIHFLTVAVAANAYLHFGIIVGLPYILDGLIRKK